MRILLKQNTALLSTVCVCLSVYTCVASQFLIYIIYHVNHQGTHQTQYILNQNHPGYLSSKDQTGQVLPYVWKMQICDYKLVKILPTESNTVSLKKVFEKVVFFYRGQLLNSLKSRHTGEHTGMCPRKL